MNDPEAARPDRPISGIPVAGESAAPAGAKHDAQRSRSLRVLLPLAVAGAGAAAVTLLHIRDPHIEGSWGLCPSYLLLGVYCPGCGGLRAVHNLTDGHLIDALHSNLLALPVLVLFALWVGDWAVRAWRSGAGPRLPGISNTTMWVLLGSIAGYTVLRNTPWGTWLTPV